MSLLFSFEQFPFFLQAHRGAPRCRQSLKRLHSHWRAGGFLERGGCETRFRFRVRAVCADRCGVYSSGGLGRPGGVTAAVRQHLSTLNVLNLREMFDSPRGNGRWSNGREVFQVAEVEMSWRWRRSLLTYPAKPPSSRRSPPASLITVRASTPSPVSPLPSYWCAACTLPAPFVRLEAGAMLRLRGRNHVVAQTRFLAMPAVGAWRPRGGTPHRWPGGATEGADPAQTWLTSSLRLTSRWHRCSRWEQLHAAGTARANSFPSRPARCIIREALSLCGGSRAAGGLGRSRRAMSESLATLLSQEV